MHLEVLVEEPSAEAALRNLLPKMTAPRTTFQIIVHNGKPDLMRKLPGRLRGYRHWLPSDYRIVVLVDRDNEDCRQLKGRLEDVARAAGFGTKTCPGPSLGFEVVNRIAIEELEAWFFGDVPAIRGAYPRVPQTLAAKRRYIDPDGIKGGTWQALERVLQRAGYHRGGLGKIETARAIAARMDPAAIRSRSFQVFRDAVSALGA
jgi:hypothetical protein